MANLTKKLPSGASLEIQMGDWEESVNLMEVIFKEAETININLGIKSKSFDEFFTANLGDEAFDTLKNIISRLVSSQNIKTAMVPLLNKTLYNGVKCTNPDIKNTEDFRGDYFLILKEVLVYNLTPFFKNLGSLFEGLPKRTISNQQQL